ncbi:tyrosine-type recombinase/integrase [Rhodobacterales bacterium HKCCSP123]|nr:tyrosine-type recombinase/integrase [Rhodobacterales bacterium HKCCSP123]
MTRAASRRPEKALTARYVETVSAPGKYFDGQGLFLRVAKNGAKQWVQRITIRGKRCELGLGSPPAVPLSEARRVALENRGKAMLGGDPLAEKRAARGRMTFAEAVERYADVRLKEIRNPKDRKRWRTLFEVYALPSFGRIDVADISVQDVLRVLQPIWQDKTETAKRLRAQIESVLSWATVAGYRTGDNPARWSGNLSEILPKPSKVAKSANQPALALADVSRWWTFLAEREGMAARALQFLALTAARSGEVRGMTWDEVDLSAGIWSVPSSRMKNGREHRVPLARDAIALLDNLPRMNNSALVFFAPRGGKLSDMSISAVMRRMQEAEVKAGGQGFIDPRSKRPAVPHGLRSTFRQWAAETGYPRDMAEIALAHWMGSEVERAYQRSDMLERRRAMMADWAVFLSRDATDDKNVLSIARKA